MISNYYNPVQTMYGAGAALRLKELLAGRKAVLVTFPDARSIGLTGRMETVLQGNLRSTIDTVLPNPDVAELRSVYERFWLEHADTEAIIAVGGGSAIDTAKALTVGTHSGKFDELIELLSSGKSFTPARHKVLIAVPTTAGTGSEVTPWATIWDRENGKKYSLHLPQTWPSHAVIDPELMLSLPASVTLQSGLDALSHALESIWNVNANPISDEFAVAAAIQIIDTLPRLMGDLGNLELRGEMALAALKAGMAFSNTKTALAHSISYEMTLRHGLPHGIACSFPLPMVCERAIGRRPDRDAVLARVFGPDLQQAPARLTAFIEGLGVKTRFTDYGVGQTEAAQLVAHALSGVRGKNFIGTVSA